jgi:DNA-binding SARP family transcriptional activator
MYPAPGALGWAPWPVSWAPRVRRDPATVRRRRQCLLQEHLIEVSQGNPRACDGWHRTRVNGSDQAEYAVSDSNIPLPFNPYPDFAYAADCAQAGPGDPPGTSRLHAPALRLLGEPASSTPDGSWLPLGRKDAALLCVLALDGPCARDTLATMLWPGVSIAKARASLRQRRFRIARTVSLAMIEGDEVLRLARGIRHTVTDADTLLADDPAALDGELLQGFSYEDCPGFEDWLGAARDNWRALRAQALARVASQLEESGRVAAALSLAQRLAAEEPLSDHAHRRLMRLHYLRGDLGAALEVYRQFAQRLDEELGEAPDDETATLAAELRLGDAPTRTARPLPPTLRRPPRLIARDQEWTTLERAWEERRSVLVEGAPGLGKSRLLEDFLARQPSRQAVAVASLPGDQAHPYAVLVRLLSRLWLDPGACQPRGFEALPDWARRELATLLPELGNGQPSIEPLRLLRASSLALAQANLIAVVIDDVQQADLASLELLPSLVGAGLPAWWLASRAGEVPGPLGQWLHSSTAPHHLRLCPFTPAEVAELLGSLKLPEAAGQVQAAELARCTGGVPLFTLEALRALALEPAKRLSTLQLAGDATRTICARLAHLPAQARQLAQLFALWREGLSTGTVAAILGGEAMAWDASFKALEAEQWLDTDLRMHDLVASALASAMSGAERKRLHGHIASWLQPQGSHVAQAAEHFEAAGDPLQAAPLLRAAARAAQRASRPEEEAALLDRAAAAWERAGRPNEQFEALQASVYPHMVAHGLDAALELAQGLVARAQGLRQIALAQATLAEHLNHDHREAEAVPLAEEAQKMARLAGDEPLALYALAQAAWALSGLGRCSDALRLLEPVQTTAYRAEPRVRYAISYALVDTLWTAGRLAEGIAVARAEALRAQAEEDWDMVTSMHARTTSILVCAGQGEEALKQCASMLRTRDRLGPIGSAVHGWTEYAAGDAKLMAGLVGSAIAHSERVLRGPGGAQQAESGWQSSVRTSLMLCHLLRGDPHRAQALDEDLPPRANIWWRFDRERVRARVAGALGRNPWPHLRLAREAHDEAWCIEHELELRIEEACAAAVPGQWHWMPQLELECREGGQPALAVRVAWWHVDALRRAGQVPAAAQRARQLLADGLWPVDLLPCHWLWIAQQALAAAGDPQAAEVAGRAQRAHAQTLADLGPLSGPAPQWAGWGAG